MSKRLFPKQKNIMLQLGENIKLAMKRRNFSQKLVAERTGLNVKTVAAIVKGCPSVSLGNYVSVLSVIGLVSDLAEVAKDDELGRKLQDIGLLK